MARTAPSSLSLSRPLMLLALAIASATALIHPPDGTIVWRTQVSITTGAIGTDDNVFVQLTKNNNFFFLDNANDNFQPAHKETFEVVGFPGLASLGDITRFKICKPTINPWQVTRVALIINNQVCMLARVCARLTADAL